MTTPAPSPPSEQQPPPLLSERQQQQQQQQRRRQQQWPQPPLQQLHEQRRQPELQSSAADKRQLQQAHHNHRLRARTRQSSAAVALGDTLVSDSSSNSQWPRSPTTLSATLANNGRAARTTVKQAQRNYKSDHSSIAIISHYFVTCLASVALVASAASRAAASPASALISTGGDSLQQQQTLAPHGTGNAEQQLVSDVIAIKEGADLDLSCPIVVQNEDMIISWTCDNEPANIRSSRIHVTDSGKLRIRSAKVGDSCNYRCEAADGYGTLSVIIKVIIVDKRLLRGRSNSTHSSQNQSAAAAAAVTVANRATSDSVIQPRGVNSGTDSTPRSNEIEIYIQPAQVRIAKNKTFTLECRVVPAYSSSGLTGGQQAQLPAPQIIWLKEFAGPRPKSLTEALEQNLLLLDNVFYHSLNWPRSITYSRKSTGSSSALLIKHSSPVHSGRYACFAGYPPPSAASLMDNITPQALASVAPPNTPLVQALPSFKPMKYKLAQALVLVDEQSDGSLSSSGHRVLTKMEQANESNNNNSGNESLPMRIFTSNSWLRNLTIATTLICTVIVVVKFIRNRTLAMKQQPNNSELQHRHNTNSNNSNVHNNNLQSPSILDDTRNHLVLEQQQQEQQPPRHLPTRSLPIDENLLNLRLNDHSIFDHRNIDYQTRTKSLEHIYSEINARDN